MVDLPLRRLLLLCVLLPCAASAQMMTFPSPGSGYGNRTSLDAIQLTQMDFTFLQINMQDPDGTPLQSPSGSVSKLDLKAPGKAQAEYQKGYQLLMRKDWPGAVEHLAKAAAIYPSYVAAHNALGSAYLSADQNEDARSEFAQAIALDDHLPNSYLNLGCAQLALKDYPSAEESLRKASTIAPLDLQLLIALAYGEFVNRDYPAVLETMRQVHERKHKGAAVVHFFAAGAWEAQDNLGEAQREMEVLLREDPKSASGDQFRQILEQIKAEKLNRASRKEVKPELAPATFSFGAGPTADEAHQQAQAVLQNFKERKQILEAEAAADSTCVDCGASGAVEAAVASSFGSGLKQPERYVPGPVLRAAVDEVTLVFTATDHGKSVMDLTPSDIDVRDDRQTPAAILGFRNESELPLRLGFVIDTSDSVTDRLSFEEAAATKFLQKVMTNPGDLAFVVGVNNSVLVVQDFTADQTLTSHAVNQLAPGGGTALWDAVAFAADKLKSHPEVQPVARILVVISDGNDNSSSVTFKQAVAKAQRGEVAVYTVSTRDSYGVDGDFVGDHALRTLSEMTGGAPFIPGSVKRLEGSLADLQQVIRGRYLVSYKPASFQRDGRYRAIDIEARKGGHQLKVFARKGYYAAGAQPDSAER